jgi:hypothetical protein
MSNWVNILRTRPLNGQTVWIRRYPFNDTPVQAVYDIYQLAFVWTDAYATYVLPWYEVHSWRS